MKQGTTIKRTFYRWLAIVVVFIIFLFALLSYKAYDFFYYPSGENYGGHPDNDRLRYEDVYFQSKDGTRLHGWFVPALTTSTQKAKGTVVHVHGNAGNITGHWPFVSWLPARGFNLFIFDYRGYGESEGRARPQGLLEDTQSAINYVHSRPDVDQNSVVVFAQSLGGNNAVAALGHAYRRLAELGFDKPTADGQSRLNQTVAGSHSDEIAFLNNVLNVKAVLIDSTFYSYASIANDKISGSRVFFSDKYSAERYIELLSPRPFLFIHNTGDRIIPYRHSERLFEKALQPKRLILIDGGQHIGAMVDYGAAYQDIAARFFEQALSGTS